MRRAVFSKFFEESIGALQTMDPKLQPVFLELFWRIAMSGIYFRVDKRTGGRRSPEVQQDLYDQVPRVTWVLCPDSNHCHGHAIDIIVIKKIGPWHYEYKPRQWLWRNWMNDRYDIIAKHARELHIDWGFNLWGVDKPHFQYTHDVEPKFVRSEKDVHVKRVYRRLKDRGIFE